MFMRSKMKSVRGFTLAELLIVVAIIGVLVAIAIPVFTSQLERSREAVDLSDVRSAYAEVMMAAITGDTMATYTKNSSETICKNNGDYSITVKPLKQQKDGWQTPLPITIGGVSSGTGEPQWVGNPGPNGSYVITYHPAEGTNSEYVSFVWSGGTVGDNGSNNPSENPGTDPSNPDNSNQNIPPTNIIGGLTAPIHSYPEIAFNGIRGNVYSYNGKLYVCINNQKYDAKGSPTGNYQWQFPELKKIEPLTSANLKENDNHQNCLENLQRGQLYFDGTDYYICHIDSKYEIAPPTNTWNWTKINSSK